MMSLCLCSTLQEKPHVSVLKINSNIIEKSLTFMERLFYTHKKQGTSGTHSSVTMSK